MGQIIKSKFKCKTGMKTLSRGYIMPIRTKYGDLELDQKREPAEWTDVFIEGKWYEGEHETWDWEDGYKCNGGWRRYWVVNESGKKEEIGRVKMNILFYKLEELRENLIDEILK